MIALSRYVGPLGPDLDPSRPPGGSVQAVAPPLFVAADPGRSCGSASSSRTAWRSSTPRSGTWIVVGIPSAKPAGHRISRDMHPLPKPSVQYVRVLHLAACRPTPHEPDRLRANPRRK